MNSATSHILKRGIHLVSRCFHQRQGLVVVIPAAKQAAATTVEKTSIDDILVRLRHPASIATIVVTFVSFMLFYAALEYVVSGVITNLAIVERTDGDCVDSTAVNESDVSLDKKALMVEDQIKQDVDLSAVEACSAQPITRSLISTLRHLRSIGGRSGQFRGLKLAALYHVGLTFYTVLFQAILAPMGPFGFWLGSVAAGVCGCNLRATWTHATISHDSDKSFLQRLLPRPSANKLILPTIRFHMALGFLQLCTVGAVYTAVSSFQSEAVPRYLSLNLFVLPVLVAMTIFFLAVIPAHIALVRVEASLLPQDMSAILPFDRTFGGLVMPQYTTRCLAVFKNFSMRGAWTTFTRDVYKRVVRISVKYFALAIFSSLSFAAVFAVEIYFIVGGHENLKRLVSYVREQSNL